MRMSSTDEAVSEVQAFFFDEQLTEEQIILEIYSRNRGKISDVDELRLDFDRIFTKKQIQKKALLTGAKFMDSADFGKDFSIQTILNIKSEQRYLNANFHGFYVLQPRSKWFTKPGEPMLLASLKNNNYYWLNQSQVVKADNKFKSALKWIQKRISSKTSSKS
jgi:predicted AlkP superfamily pyrophosphatase or phosphodiesterase